MRRSLALATALLVLPAATAGAAARHVVAPGETLWSIAAANNLTTRSVAAFNGLPANARVVLGATIRVPTRTEGFAALQRGGVARSAAGVPALAVAGARHRLRAAASAAAPAPQGAYVVRWGDTLSGLAATSRVSLGAIAVMNGLDAQRPLLAGTVLKLPAGAPPPPRASLPAPAATVVPRAAPHATPGRLTAGTVGSIAAAHGVPASLAAAIAYQESGFNNAKVSAANARGVMQIMPGTWSWIQLNLARPPLNPNLPADNARAGALYLRHLLMRTHGNTSLAIAGYYQGLGSVLSRGMFDDTKRYVANVQALRARFGG